MFDPNGNKRLRKEILINFMTYNLVRFIRYDKEQPFILKFLGADSYNDIIKTASHDAKKLEETIIAYYKSKLREKGLYVVSQRIQCKDPKDPHAEHIYFHMVHCSHNERALLEMRESFVKVKEQKKVFEKELNGDQIDFFEYAGFDEIALEFSKQELVTFVKSYFMLNRPFLLRELFTLCLQEISISYYVIREMLHDLWKQGILSIKNLDNKNRRKPFNEAIKNWKFIEVTLLKEKISESNTVQEQLTLF